MFSESGCFSETGYWCFDPKLPPTLLLSKFADPCKRDKRCSAVATLMALNSEHRCSTSASSGSDPAFAAWLICLFSHAILVQGYRLDRHHFAMHMAQENTEQMAQEFAGQLELILLWFGKGIDRTELCWTTWPLRHHRLSNSDTRYQLSSLKSRDTCFVNAKNKPTKTTPMAPFRVATSVDRFCALKKPKRHAFC